jgi:hypothetical protein
LVIAAREHGKLMVAALALVPEISSMERLKMSMYLA